MSCDEATIQGVEGTDKKINLTHYVFLAARTPEDIHKIKEPLQWQWKFLYRYGAPEEKEVTIDLPEEDWLDFAAGIERAISNYHKGLR